MLYLNHLSARYSEPSKSTDEEAQRARETLEQIAALASAAWQGGQAVVASDLLEVDVPRPTHSQHAVG